MKTLLTAVLGVAFGVSALNAPAAAAAAAVSTIPLCVGLTIVTAISQTDGDYESIKTVQSVDADGVQLGYSTEHPRQDVPGGPTRLEKLRVSRLVRFADLGSSNLYEQQYQTNLPNAIPGTTAIGTSKAVLTALKTLGKAQLGMFDLPPPLPGGSRLSVDANVHPNVFDSSELYALQRVEVQPVMLMATVNGVKTALPAIHATGRSEYYGYKSEFFFLDDPANPLALKWRLRIGSVTGGPKAGADRDTLDVVKISYHCSAPAAVESTIERALLLNHRVDVFDIYFSFNSADLREESQPTLTEIGALLRRHPDWKLRIEGHTDNIAGDAFNLELSKRRAAAVKSALVTRFGADPARFVTDGHGRSMPADTNDTPEGRARNRRVELIREE